MEKKTRNMTFYLVSLACITMLASCARYLDVKPDSSLALPKTLKDLQAILDNETRRNTSYAYAGDVAADYYYLLEPDFNRLNDAFDARNIYLWEPNASADRDWSNLYLNIFDVNVVLEEIGSAESGNLTEMDRDRIQGTAHFIRGWCFFQLAQLFAVPYEGRLADQSLGIPLRLTPNIEAPTARSSLAETYQQIIADLSLAIELLPVSSPVAVRPDKTAAHAALARVYLIMGDYQRSLDHANTALKLENGLIDFNDLDPLATKPIEMLNIEVLFHAQIPNGGGGFVTPRARVDSSLYASYHDGDLRKQIYYQQNADGSYYFKGDYGTNPGVPFAGLAINELWLIKAECHARLSNVDFAIESLNTLLVNRWEKSEFVPYQATDADDALELIIAERNKELAFRAGIRWSDLRRLNKDLRFAKILTRKIGDVTYVLEPDDNRYTFLIPATVVQQTGIEQNVR